MMVQSWPESMRCLRLNFMDARENLQLRANVANSEHTLMTTREHLQLARNEEAIAAGEVANITQHGIPRTATPSRSTRRGVSKYGRAKDARCLRISYPIDPISQKSRKS